MNLGKSQLQEPRELFNLDTLYSAVSASVFSVHKSWLYGVYFVFITYGVGKK